MEQLLVVGARHLLIILAEFAIARLLHYIWTRLIAPPAAQAVPAT